MDGGLKHGRGQTKSTFGTWADIIIILDDGPSFEQKSRLQKIINSAFSNFIVLPYAKVCAASIHLLPLKKKRAKLTSLSF